MDLKFTPIDYWPDRNIHLKHINMSLAIASGKTFSEAGKIFHVSGERAWQVYSILICALCMRKFNLSWEEAMHDKKYYNHNDSVNIIEDYKKQYMKYKKITKPPTKRPNRSY